MDSLNPDGRFVRVLMGVLETMMLMMELAWLWWWGWWAELITALLPFYLRWRRRPFRDFEELVAHIMEERGEDEDEDEP